MRAAIAGVPDGVYENEGLLDGFDKPLTIRVSLTVRGDAIDYDFTGTSPQIPKGINCCFNYTFGYVSFATKAALEPKVPNNEGCFRPVRMTVPEASLLNSKRPAPGNSRGRVGHMIVPVVFGALAKALPDAIPAEPGAPAPRANFFGSLDDGREFQCLLITSGGLGAQAHRDGLACKAFPTNTTMASLEIMELSAPLRFLKRELIPDSGGPGRYRGGLGQEIVVEALGSGPVYVSTSVERMNNPPLGYRGGGGGAPAGLWKNANEYLPPKARSQLEPGDTVTIRTPGGGGFGPAAERAPNEIQADVAADYVSTERAALYGKPGRTPARKKSRGDKPA
jgi:N-methylhydantoinase B